MKEPDPAFAADPATAAYYELRASEYDDWYLGRGRFQERDRPGWQLEVDGVIALVEQLPASRTLDVACGTGFLTGHLHGTVVGIDQSPSMVRLARERIAQGTALVGSALALPVPDGAFERLLTGHFYGHLPPAERETFLSESWRVARELIVIDSARRDGLPAEQWQERVLNDGSRHTVYKRFLTGAQLAEEIDGDVLFDGRWFVAARSTGRA